MLVFPQFFKNSGISSQSWTDGVKKANQNKRKTLNGDIDNKKQLLLKSSKQDHENEKQITENISEWLILHGHFQPSRFVKSSLGMSFDKK